MSTSIFASGRSSLPCASGLLARRVRCRARGRARHRRRGHRGGAAARRRRRASADPAGRSAASDVVGRRPPAAGRRAASPPPLAAAGPSPRGLRPPPLGRRSLDRRRRRSGGFSREIGFTRARIRASVRPMPKRPPRGSSMTSYSSSSATTPSRSSASSRASSSVRAETSIHSTVSASASSCGARPELMPWPLPLPFGALPFGALLRRPASCAGGFLPFGVGFALPLPGRRPRCRSSSFGVGSVVVLGARLELAGRDRLVVHLADHEVLLADAPDVRDDEVDGRAGVEAEGDEPEEDREDLRHRLHLRVRRRVAALQLAGLRLAHLVPTGEHDERRSRT